MMILVEIIVLVLLTAGIVYLFVDAKKAKEDVDNKINLLKNEQEILKKITQCIYENKEELSVLHKQFIDFKKEHEFINSDLTLLKNFISNQSENNTMIKNKPQFLYFVKPINNAFPCELQSLIPDGTVYKLEINDDNLTGYFVIHKNGANITEIIKRSETYVKPACTELNTPGKDSENIITITPGEVVLENNKWVIKQKASVSYE